MSYRIYAPGTRKGNRFWLARIWVWGREHELVCREKDGSPAKDARSANRLARKFHTEAIRQGRPASITQTKPITFADAAERYIVGRNVSRQMETRVRLLANDPIFGQLPIDGIVPADIDDAAHRIRRPNHRKAILSNHSKNREIIAPAAAVLHYAHENEWCRYLKIKALDQPKPHNRRPVPGTGDALLSATSGLERLLILLWFRQGWRLGESLTLQADKIDLNERTIELWISKAQTWKLLEMHDDVFFELANMDLPKQGPVFAWTRWQVYGWLRPLCTRLGLKFTPHMARHEFGSAIRDGRALVEVGTWTSEAGTRRYVHGDREFRRRILANVRGR